MCLEKGCATHRVAGAMRRQEPHRDLLPELWQCLCCTPLLPNLSPHAHIYTYTCTCVHVQPPASLCRSWTGRENWEERGFPHPSLTLVPNSCGMKERSHLYSRVSEGHKAGKYMGWPVRHILSQLLGSGSQLPDFYHVPTTMATCLL